MKSPAILFYTSDFLTGVMFMSNEQVGKYIKLLCMQHQQGSLTEEDFFSICTRNDKKIIDKFVIDKNGNYFNKRMAEEIEKRNKYSKSRSENRKIKPIKIKEKSKKDMKNICKTYDEHMENENENINSNIYSIIYYINNSILNELFIDFLKLRRKLKAENTERAIKLLINKLDPYDDETKIKMIEKSIENSWKGLFPLKEINKKLSAEEKLERWANSND